MSIKNNHLVRCLVLVLTALFASVVQASHPVTGDSTLGPNKRLAVYPSPCGIHPSGLSFYRYADSTSAVDCTTLDQNPKLEHVVALHPSQDVEQVAEVKNGIVDQDVRNHFGATSNDWGNILADGTWQIDPEFWLSYGQAVVTMHIGSGGDQPAAFMFRGTDGATGAVWLTRQGPGSGVSGGEMSNIKLWGVNRIPEPSVITLFGIGFPGWHSPDVKSVKRSNIQGRQHKNANAGRWS